MSLEISPEPSAAERAAIEAALAQLAAEDERSGSGAWWRAGLAENLAPDDADARAD